MKKNQKTYVLLAVVLLVWSLLGYKILGALGDPEEPASAKTALADFKPLPQKARDTFSIAVNYRDPFLETKPRRMLQIKPTPQKKAVAPQPKKNIQYTGFITDTGAKQKIFFITIDGQQQMLSAGEKVGEVKLVSGTEQKIRVAYGGRTHTIVLAQ